jgi:glycosyltransferase involved in cell wall biosynthesis
VNDRKSNPTIAFDTWILGPHARNHGIQVYAKKLLGHFREMAPRYSVEVMPYVSPAADYGVSHFEAAPGFRPSQTRLLQHGRTWRWGGASLLAAMGKADLVFSPAATTLYFGSFVPSVTTIHDLIPVVVPLGSKRINRALRFLYWSAAKFSRAVITDSNHSKSDLVNLYRVPESKVSVVYLGCDKESFNSSPLDAELHRALMTRLGVAKPYIVHHGVIKAYKNLKRLIQAYRLVLDRNRNLDLELVLAGPLGSEYEEVLEEANNGAGRRGRVIFTQALSDGDLAMLVKGASLAVIPSLYEGFCLPLVESMACGVPTIAANRSCLPEVSGGVLRYFDPESVEEMSACMEEALENQTLRSELAEKGQMRAGQFDWRRCADETLAILARVAHETRKR